MTTLTYTATARLLPLAHRAAAEWERVMGGLVTFDPQWCSHAKCARIAIVLGEVNRTRDAGRVAQHEIIDGHHLITLAADVTWRVTPWQRFFGSGAEDAYAALLHEFGHVLGLPHSARNDVMHAQLGTTVISPAEAEYFRKFYAELQKPSVRLAA